MLITLDVAAADPGVASITERLLDDGAVEHVFTTAEADLVVNASVPDNDVASWLADALDGEAVGDFGVTLLAGADWAPDLSGTAFALTCAQCGNTVDSEGTATRIDGEVHQFCCPSCASRFEETYDRLQQGADRGGRRPCALYSKLSPRYR